MSYKYEVKWQVLDNKIVLPRYHYYIVYVQPSPSVGDMIY